MRRNDLDGAARYFSEALPPLLEMEHFELLAYCLREVAMLALRQGRLPRAAKLTAAAERLRDLHGLADWPIREDVYSGALAALRRRLREPEIERAWNEGRRLTLGEAVAYALEAPEHATPGHTNPEHERLSARETEVAVLIAQGLTSREIATELVISEKTVDSHADHIRTKLGLRSRAEIAAWAVRQARGAG
jgi:non-specific serine/threonine protein kinase